MHRKTHLYEGDAVVVCMARVAAFRDGVHERMKRAMLLSPTGAKVKDIEVPDDAPEILQDGSKFYYLDTDDYDGVEPFYYHEGQVFVLSE